ncbi:glycoside hydrolase family 25 protein [Alicyclobacillus fodiniaquatilis]|uniref:Glycoside hydrolase family 25 protein n=1 Tax=Alicyclobacillus fodiniaquatilis TaxID=1661150 RepID=A0ABW4JF69_9BACL
MQTRKPTDALGIDVSAYQGNINWEQVAQANISFAFIKATEGSNITDSKFPTNFPAAKAAGLLRGVYCYARPGQSSAAIQANYFINTMKSNGGFGELPPVLDVEDNGGLTNAALATWIKDWVDLVASAAGKKPMIYTYPNFADTYLEPTLASSIPVWIANYDVSQPANAAGWTSWTFWQYSDTGSIPGINGNVDLDVYAGTVTDLKNTYAPTPASTTYPIFNVFVLDHPYSAIAVDNVTYVLWTALNTMGTPHVYKGNGVMTVNGKDVQGIVYQGSTYLPWDSLASSVKSEKVWHFYS